MSVKQACGDMHSGGYTGFDAGCYGCRKASGMPSVEQMDAAYEALQARADRLAEALDEISMWECETTTEKYLMTPVIVAAREALTEYRKPASEVE